jgi:hypothetical protein
MSCNFSRGFYILTRRFVYCLTFSAAFNVAQAQLYEADPLFAGPMTQWSGLDSGLTADYGTTGISSLTFFGFQTPETILSGAVFAPLTTSWPGRLIGV